MSSIPTDDPDVTSNTGSAFCQVCQTTIFATQLPRKPSPQNSFIGEYDHRGVHHWATSSLSKSAAEGSRICSAVWQHRTYILEDFLSSITFWKPTTYYDENSLVLEIEDGDRCEDTGNIFTFSKMKLEGNPLPDVLHQPLSDCL
jgi:hypothetical protein